MLMAKVPLLTRLHGGLQSSCSSQLTRPSIFVTLARPPTGLLASVIPVHSIHGNILFRPFSKDVDSNDQIILDHLSNNENVPGGVVSILTLNRPNAANAMNRTMLLELKEALKELEEQQHEPQSRCVILASASSRVFSAGADLKERRTMSLEEAQEFVTDLRQTLHRVSELPMPVIAAISGTALGGGLELALCADLRVANESAVMGLVETSLAIIPGAGGTQRLPRLIGLSKAKELVFTAAKVSARQALEYGLVDYVVCDSNQDDGTDKHKPEAQQSPSRSSPVLDKAWELAWKVARNGPVAVQAAKRAMNQGMFASEMQTALDVERHCYSQILATNDRLEGLAAFSEKRTPQYTGE